ncbi:bifunctional riboflavin kinase/FAD synthetase [Compostimonas suwonensis]|uniref:Riboflavin biosynthesis protein n=1 Tax=Compostimonas suwonensis TaxID=1048394 RepID=A0A2M9BUC4_9MICO|nr:bifunctional riboflavin kinase/FAD synthetase [Compostimonas suwonensis]PJJ61512.1 riboflavin kinase/FMN adenylyltransferase [Compostimonas suwonensis]
MRVFRDPAEVPAGFGPSAVTIGKFDGVHAGHRAVLAELFAVAGRESLVPAVVTFDRHPLVLLAPETCPETLVGVEQKLELLAETGVEASLVLTFDEALASLSPQEFVERVLVHALHAREVLVGGDFRFGHRGAGTIDTLRSLGEQHGFGVRVIPDLLFAGRRRVSSTWIRQLLAEGNVKEAAELLGHVPTVRGVVVHGAKRGRELGFPTANLSPESDGLIPADGVYAGWLTDHGVRYPAAISVGSNPTFDGVPPKQVEAFVLDEELDLYDHVVDVSFVARIRGMVAYSGVEPLIEQISADVQTVRSILL